MSEKELVEALEQAQAQIAEMEEFIKVVKSGALAHASVVVVLPKEKKILLSKGGEQILVGMPAVKGVTLAIGDSVFLSPMTGQIVEKLAVPSQGILTKFIKRVNKDLVEIESENTRKAVYAGRLGSDVKEGADILLDKSASVVLEVLSTAAITSNLRTEPTGVSFKDIAGLEDAKRELNDAIILPYVHPKVYAYYKKKPPKGILFYGPPGCGKTMLAKAAATALAEVCRSHNKAPGFIYIKGPEILERYVGSAEATVRRIFTEARTYAAEQGHPALIFIDEADAILGARGTGISSDMEKTVVPTFLAEMDGLDATGAIVILATNRSVTLDPAVTREGRVDRKIRVGRPTLQAATDVFALNLKSIPVGKENVNTIAIAATKALYAPERVMYKVRTEDKQVHDFGLQHIVNGAMIANVVDLATSAAMHRDLKAGTTTGLKLQDLYDAIDRTQQQNLEVNHADNIEEFLAIHANGAKFKDLSAA